MNDSRRNRVTKLLEHPSIVESDSNREDIVEQDHQPGSNSMKYRINASASRRFRKHSE